MINILSVLPTLKQTWGNFLWKYLLFTSKTTIWIYPNDLVHKKVNSSSLLEENQELTHQKLSWPDFAKCKRSFIDMLKTSTASKPIFLVSPRLSLSREATQHATSRQDRDKTSRSISQQAAKQTVASNTKTPPVYVRLRLGIITIKESYCIDHTKRSSVVQKEKIQWRSVYRSLLKGFGASLFFCSFWL